MSIFIGETHQQHISNTYNDDGMNFRDGINGKEVNGNRITLGGNHSNKREGRNAREAGFHDVHLMFYFPFQETQEARRVVKQVTKRRRRRK